jgi:hypothetical protein
MKKLFLAFVCILGLATTSFSQNEIAAQRAKNLNQVERAAQSINLDDATVTKLKKIFQDLYKTQDDINALENLSPEVRKDRLMKANALKDSKIKELLSDKYNAYLEAKKKAQLADEAAAKQ